MLNIKCHHPNVASDQNAEARSPRNLVALYPQLCLGMDSEEIHSEVMFLAERSLRSLRNPKKARNPDLKQLSKNS